MRTRPADDATDRERSLERLPEPGDEESSVDPAEDPTLETSQYVLYGVPSPTRVWSSGDYALAAEAISKLYEEDPKLLPRLDSAKSGEVFDRLVASENLAVLRDETVPMATRGKAGAGFGKGLGAITRLYLQALADGEPLKREVLALQAQLLRYTVATRALAGTMAEGIAPDDPARATRLAGFEKVKAGHRASVDSTVIVLSARDEFSNEDYRWFLSIIREPLTEGIRQLDDQARGEMLLRLMSLRGDERDPESAAMLERIARDASK